MDKTDTSKVRWFARGFAGGFILIAALNALSWFFRSEGWSDLCGFTLHEHTEAIGFPFEMWREGFSYSNSTVSLPSLGLNLAIGLVFAIGAGLLGIKLSRRILATLPTDIGPNTTFQMTFSVRGLLIVTTLLAIAIGLTKSLGASPWLLGTIYFASPLILILIAMGPVGLPWEQRSIILVLTAVCMMAGAVLVGSRLEMEFDRVLLGAFICWVPQSVFAALGIIVIALWKHRLSGRQF